MNNKLVATLLLAGMVLGTGQAVFAEEQVPTDYQTIDNADGNEYDPTTGVEIPVNGTLGKLDNTNPDENIPEGDDRWIHVTLPTKVAFNTNPEEHTEINASKYIIKNLSGRQVKVNLAKFTGSEVPALKKLTLSPTTGNAIDLVTDGVVTSNENELMVNNLEASTGVYEFTYTGTVDTALIEAETTRADEVASQQVSYSMNLKFEVLDKNGNSIIKP